MTPTRDMEMASGTLKNDEGKSDAIHRPAGSPVFRAQGTSHQTRSTVTSSKKTFHASVPLAHSSQPTVPELEKPKTSLGTNCAIVFSKWNRGLIVDSFIFFFFKF